jgi:N-acetyl-gamma-glutamyl-phosphate reductase common form
MNKPITTFVLGGSGYVAGELLRLLSLHSHFELKSILSETQGGSLLATAFPHLAGSYPTQRFHSLELLMQEFDRHASIALFSAAPHGAAASLIDRLLQRAEKRGATVRVVDVSADFRYTTAEKYSAVYQHDHGATHRLAGFSCAVPEHAATVPTPHIAHPGCFATAILLSTVPLLAHKLIAPEVWVSAVTGSSGSGRSTSSSTHHPQRHSDYCAYKVLDHRHTPEIVDCALAASGEQLRCNFVAHSGPFSRGIYATVQAKLTTKTDSSAVNAILQDFYNASPFIQISAELPRIKNVIGSNYAQLHAAVNNDSLVVLCALDNLLKGAAGGAMQWMNRLWNLPQTTGLLTPPVGWV